MNSLKRIDDILKYLKSRFKRINDGHEGGDSTDVFQRLVLFERLKDDMVDFEAKVERNSVFVSGSINSEFEKKVLKLAIRVGEDLGLLVHVGIEPGGYPNPLEMAYSRIVRSNMFMSVMLPRYKIEIPDDGSPAYAPSVWISEEKGIALGLRKEVVCICEERILVDFAASTIPDRFIYRFDADDWFSIESALENGFNALIDRHASKDLLIKDFERLYVFEE